MLQRLYPAEVYLQINPADAGRLGISMQVVNDTLNDAFGQRQISTIYGQANQYRVILEAQREALASLENVDRAAGEGDFVVLDFVGKVTMEGTPDFVRPAERIAVTGAQRGQLLLELRDLGRPDRLVAGRRDEQADLRPSDAPHDVEAAGRVVGRVDGTIGTEDRMRLFPGRGELGEDDRELPAGHQRGPDVDALALAESGRAGGQEAAGQHGGHPSFDIPVVARMAAVPHVVAATVLDKIQGHSSSGRHAATAMPHSRT